MRSISIVYKKPHKQVTQNQFLNTVRGRRSVDQYHHKLQQKAHKKSEQDEQRTHTSNAVRSKSKCKFFASLKVIKIGNNSTQPIIRLRKSQVNIDAKKIFSVRKTQGNFFAFKVPTHNNFIHGDLSSNQQQKDKACKLKSLLQLPDCKKKETIVVLSVDFILNEMNFWQEESIDQGAFKVWKTIQNIANIIWIARRQNSLKKINSYIKQNNLNQDGIYLVLPRRNLRTLSVSYSVVQRELRLERESKLIVINGLRVESIKEIHYSQFYSLVPQIKHSQTFIHFAQIDINDKNRFSNVLKILSKNLPKPVSLNGIYQEFYLKQAPYLYEKQKETPNMQPICNQFMLQRVQTLKKNYCNYFSRSFGMKKPESDISIPYIVGDMLRRNFNTLKEAYKMYKHFQERENSEQLADNNLLQKSQTSKVYFNRPVYIWKF